MPRSKEDNQKIRVDRIEDIFNAAIRVYAKNGYSDTQMDDIAKEAGMAKGLLYYYYKGKTDLFQHVFKTLMERARSNSELLASSTPSFKETLGKFIDHFIAASINRSFYPLAYKMMPEDLEKVFPNNAAEMQETFFQVFTKPMIERFSAAMESGEIPQGNASIQSLIFVNGVLAVSHLVAKNPSMTDGKSREEIIKEIRQQLFHGIFNQGGII